MARMLERIDLPIKVLLHRRNARVAEIHASTVPEVPVVREKRNDVLGLTFGTFIVQWRSYWPFRYGGCPTTMEVERWP
jgi:hypothetical protein